MTSEFSLDEALARVATIGACHWVKGWFVANRLARRNARWRPAILKAVANSDWDQAPRCDGVLANDIWSGERFMPARALRLMARGLFPTAYLAAHDWVRQDPNPAQGFARLLEETRARAINESGHLGHGFSIWAGYLDLSESGLLENASRRVQVATERFAEYVAQTLPGYPVGENQWAAPPFGEVTSHSFARVLDDSLLEPGFFGHNVILLSHALRHRQRLTEKEWMRLLAQTESATRLAASDADPDSHPETHAPSNHRLELNEVVEDHLRRRPGNVHRITLCDAVITLWDGASPLQKQRLLALLEAV